MKLPGWLDPPFWWGWPSRLVELLGGILIGLAAVGLTPWWWARAVLMAAATLIYERWVDPNRGKPDHRPVDDVLERVPGMLLVVGIAIGRGW